jgi:hypothetical protein
MMYTQDMHYCDIQKSAWKKWTQLQKTFSDNIYARQNENSVPIEYEISLYHDVQIHTFSYLKGNTVIYS